MKVVGDNGFLHSCLGLRLDAPIFTSRVCYWLLHINFEQSRTQ